MGVGLGVGFDERNGNPRSVAIAVCQSIRDACRNPDCDAECDFDSHAKRNAER